MSFGVTDAGATIGEISDNPQPIGTISNEYFTPVDSTKTGGGMWGQIAGAAFSALGSAVSTPPAGPAISSANPATQFGNLTVNRAAGISQLLLLAGIGVMAWWVFSKKSR